VVLLLSRATTLQTITVIVMPSLSHSPTAELQCNYLLNSNDGFRTKICFRFAGVVVFSIIGFKATATFDECEEANTIAGKELKKCSLQDELSNSASGTGEQLF
jgi:hypothetical protein